MSDFDWGKMAECLGELRELARAHNITIWFGPDGHEVSVEAYRMKYGEREDVAEAGSPKELLEKLVKMRDAGGLDSIPPDQKIDPVLWRIHVRNKAYGIDMQLQDMQETFHRIIGPLGLVYDKYSVVDMNISRARSSLGALCAAINRIRVPKEKEDVDGNSEPPDQKRD